MFPSKSGSKPHKVYAWKPGAPEVNGCFCSCQAFIFGRSKLAKAEGVDPREVTFVCKHLQQVFEDTCDWIQHVDADYQYDQTCPKCRGPLVDTDAPMIPQDETGAVNDLRAMLAELNGEEPPEPIPAPPEPQDFQIAFTVSTDYRITIVATSEEEARSIFESTDVDRLLRDDSLEPMHEEVEITGVRTDEEPTPPEPKPRSTNVSGAVIDLASNVSPRR